MLDFVYYPVSAVLWAWHNLLAAVLGPSSALSWVLAVVFLVATLRAVLVVPFLKQARFQQVMLRLQPQIAAIQKRYPSDRRRQSAEIQKLQREHGVNLLLGCLPMLAQSVVFVGLFHVLRSFDRTGAAMHLPFLGGLTPMSAEQNAHTRWPSAFDSAVVKKKRRSPRAQMTKTWRLSTATTNGESSGSTHRPSPSSSHPRCRGNQLACLSWPASPSSRASSSSPSWPR